MPWWEEACAEGWEEEVAWGVAVEAGGRAGTKEAMDTIREAMAAMEDMVRMQDNFAMEVFWWLNILGGKLHALVQRFHFWESFYDERFIQFCYWKIVM